jgi:flagellar basal body-associated protein FliL
MNATGLGEKHRKYIIIIIIIIITITIVGRVAQSV